MHKLGMCHLTPIHVCTLTVSKIPVHLYGEWGQIGNLVPMQASRPDFISQPWRKVGNFSPRLRDKVWAGCLGTRLPDWALDS